MFASLHTSFPAYMQILLMPIPIHLALFGGPRDYIGQKDLELSPSFLCNSHMFVKQSCCFRSIRMRGKMACCHIKPIQVSLQKTANETFPLIKLLQ